MLPRGNTWDVACTRITERLALPKLGYSKTYPRSHFIFMMALSAYANWMKILLQLLVPEDGRVKKLEDWP